MSTKESGFSAEIESIHNKLHRINCITGYIVKKAMETDDVLLGETLQVAEELGLEAIDEFHELMKHVEVQS